jgi:hypothetical protein
LCNVTVLDTAEALRRRGNAGRQKIAGATAIPQRRPPCRRDMKDAAVERAGAIGFFNCTRDTLMTKTVLTLAAAASLAAAAVLTPTQSQAGGGCWGCAVGAGILGGVIIGSAIANAARPYPPPAPGYVVYPGYAAPGPVACPGGYWARRPIAFDAYGDPIQWSRPHYFCP